MQQKASFGGAVQNLNADIVRATEITILPKEKQNEMVAIPDRFSLLCTDISGGLPAEIEARQSSMNITGTGCFDSSRNCF